MQDVGIIQIAPHKMGLTTEQMDVLLPVPQLQAQQRRGGAGSVGQRVAACLPDLLGGDMADIGADDQQREQGQSAEPQGQMAAKAGFEHEAGTGALNRRHAMPMRRRYAAISGRHSTDHAHLCAHPADPDAHRSA